MPVDDALDRIATKALSAIADEQRLTVGSATFSQPGSQDLDAVFPERG
jgi:hypothetical protein